MYISSQQFAKFKAGSMLPANTGNDSNNNTAVITTAHPNKDNFDHNNHTSAKAEVKLCENFNLKPFSTPITRKHFSIFVFIKLLINSNGSLWYKFLYYIYKFIY